jgi:hypothetical protein
MEKNVISRFYLRQTSNCKLISEFSNDKSGEIEIELLIQLM